MFPHSTLPTCCMSGVRIYSGCDQGAGAEKSALMAEGTLLCYVFTPKLKPAAKKEKLKAILDALPLQTKGYKVDVQALVLPQLIEAVSKWMLRDH